MPKIGIAMIARNAEELMPLALDPFSANGTVDEIAIVLGGISSDGTPELAEKYATLPVEAFCGDVDKDGRLMSFAQARQQSFDILARAGCEYALVIDTDDQWVGIEHLRNVLEATHKGGFPQTVFPYRYQGGEFLQPRIYRIDSGYWQGPCHNYWELNDGIPRTGLQTDMMAIVQERPPAMGEDRRKQNIRISQKWMAKHGDNPRLLLHMSKDMMVDHDFEGAEDALNRYFIAYEVDDKNDPEELYNAYHARAALYLMGNRFDEALFDTFRALAIRPHGQTWTLAAESAGWLAQSSRESRTLLKLAAFCAEQAIETGKPRGNLHWHSENLTGALPFFLKARALAGLGDLRKARGALDVALLMQPDYVEARNLLKDISRQLGELE